MEILKKYKELENVTMSPTKRASAKNDYFAFYVGRPLSYLLTIPFLNSKITPNQISYLSIVPLFIGFGLMSCSTSKGYLILGWAMFFLWNLLDGVDGNLARYRKQFSKDGSVIDAMAGYAAMVLVYFAAGIAAAHLTGQNIYIILGSFSGIFQIFPRLIMHKYINTVGLNTASSDIKDKSSFGPVKVFALNMTSIAGLPQFFLLIAIVFNFLPIFTTFYFIVNVTVMFVSLHSLLFRT